MSIRVCVGGATGWTGESIVSGVLASDEFKLTGAVARQAAGQTIGDIRITAGVREALDTPADVYIDYTHPTVVYEHVMAAIEAGVAAVVGTSGLSAREYAEIDRAARARGVGVIAAGNFSVTAALLKHFSGIAARHVPHWEIIDMASAAKPDAPSGTAQELAEFLGTVADNKLARPVDETLGSREARGATIGGAQVHSLRLPSYVISVESIFGLPGERLSIRHDAGSSAEPYVGGTLLAARLAPERAGLTQGLGRLLFDPPAAEG